MTTVSYFKLQCDGISQITLQFQLFSCTLNARSVFVKHKEWSTAVKSQKAVTAYYSSNSLQSSDFADQNKDNDPSQ